LAGILDTNAARAQAVAGQFGVPAFTSLNELIAAGQPNAVSVAVPTTAHLEVAGALMQAGIDVLVEKPLAATLAQADELVRLCQAHQRIGQAGHLERFNPAVRATLPLITRPMFFEVHRLSLFTPRALDVDVVLDLMIHDIDLVLTFVQSPVKEIRAVGLPILSGKVDIANVRMEFESGCVANFTASRVSTERVRKLRFFQPRQYISIDYTRQDVLVLTVDQNAIAQAAAFMGTASPSPNISGLIGAKQLKAEQEEPLRAELHSFLDAVRRRTPPVVPLEDGRRALAVALDVLGAIAQHSRQIGLG
jgi:predicted dehydrogenase